MNSLPTKILTAVITFAIGVGVASIWLSHWWATPAIDPVPMNPPTRLEMVFVLDTTGSMGGLLSGAKQRIWGIVNEVMQESNASVRIGLVAYRDREDDYLTQVLPLTEDLDKVYTTLMEYRPEGGGDGPEDVRTALADGVNKAGWSPAAPDLAQILFLVGDAPPHNDYDDVPDTLVTTVKAVQRGIIVNTIQCGTVSDTSSAWQAIRLGGTVITFGYGAGAGGEEKRSAAARNLAEIETRVALDAPSSAKAERAMNKVLSKEAYVGDLLQSIENGSVKLETVNRDDLPGYLRDLDPAQRHAEVEKRLAERHEIRSRILSLSKQREAFIDAERQKSGDTNVGFDAVVGRALKQQMARKSPN
jgi:hypothetical protein